MFFCLSPHNAFWFLFPQIRASQHFMEKRQSVHLVGLGLMHNDCEEHLEVNETRLQHRHTGGNSCGKVLVYLKMTCSVRNCCLAKQIRPHNKQKKITKWNCCTWMRFFLKREPGNCVAMVGYDFPIPESDISNHGSLKRPPIAPLLCLEQRPRRDV